MIDKLAPYLPEAALMPCYELIKVHGVHLKIVNERKTRHGDYRLLPGGGHQITINASSNPYRFLITLIHEIAHLVAFVEHGRRIQPHGSEWKQCFRNLMVPFLHTEIFPDRLLRVVARHFKSPKASSSTDPTLDKALSEFDSWQASELFVSDVLIGELFLFREDRLFKRGLLRRKRIECVEIPSGKQYLFQPNARVILAPKSDGNNT